MKWYYAEGTNSKGPFEADEFMELVKNGTVEADALVWRTGMSEWKKLSDVELPEVDSGNDFDASSSRASFEEASYGDAFESAAGTAAAAHVETEYESMGTGQLCVECGGTFPESDMVSYGGQWICQRCKPLFLQKIKEGMGVAGGLRYGGFWIRFVAKLIDFFILGLFGALINGVLGAVVPMGPESEEGLVVFVVLSNILQIALAVGYTTYFLGKFAATPGKMACGLKVITPEGDPITYSRALGRYFAEVLSGLILGIGYLMAAFDEEKKTLHDRVAGTRVVKK